MQFNQSPDRRPMSSANRILILVVVLIVFSAAGISILMGNRDQNSPAPTSSPAPAALTQGGELATIDEALQSITPTPTAGSVFFL